MLGPFAQQCALQVERMPVRVTGGDAAAGMVEHQAALPFRVSVVLQEGCDRVPPRVEGEVGGRAVLDQSANKPLAVEVPWPRWSGRRAARLALRHARAGASGVDVKRPCGALHNFPGDHHLLDAFEAR